LVYLLGGVNVTGIGVAKLEEKLKKREGGP